MLHLDGPKGAVLACGPMLQDAGLMTRPNPPRREFGNFPLPERHVRLIMALQACLDDSGEFDETINPAFALAGFIAEAEDWAALSADWQSILDQHPRLEYFKMVEAINLRGQFSNELGWTAELRDSRIDSFISIIKKHVKRRVSISVDKEAFFTHLRALDYPQRNNNVDKPYCLAFHRIILEILALQALHSRLGFAPPRPVDFIFDEQGQIGIEAQVTWLMIKRLCERLAQAGRTDFRPFLGNRPIFRDEKTFLPLQASDLIRL
jgi:hypothetical protein